MTLEHQFKKYSTYGQENNSQHHCITKKDWYINSLTHAFASVFVAATPLQLKFCIF